MSPGYFAVQTTLFFKVLCEKKLSFTLWIVIRLHFSRALSQSDLCPRFINISTYAKRTFCICNRLAYFLLQCFAVCKSRAKGWEGCNKISVLFSPIHPENFFSKFWNPIVKRSDFRGKKVCFWAELAIFPDEIWHLTGVGKIIVNLSSYISSLFTIL